MVLIPLISALATATHTIIDKVILSRQKMDYRAFTIITFIYIFLIMLLLSPFLLNYLDLSLLRDVRFFLPVLMVAVLAATYNVLFFHGLKLEKVYESQLFAMSIPLFTVLIVSIFYASERHPLILGAALVASLALVWSHLRKGAFKIGKGSLMILSAAFLIGLEAVLLKSLLTVFEPFSMYFVRVLFASIILLAYYRPKFKPLPVKHHGFLFLVSFLMFTQFYFMFIGYALYGVNYTTLILTSIPIFVYFFDWVFLKEKIKPKVLLAAAIILLSILAVQLLA